MTPSFEYRNGQMIPVDDINVAADIILDTVSRTVVVRDGAELTTTGTVSGTVHVQSGTWIARGNVTGTVRICHGAQATFHEHMDGTLHVDVGGHAELLSDSEALGTMRIDGLLVNKGTRGMNVSGTGTIDDREGGRVREPDEVMPDGTAIYRG